MACMRRRAVDDINVSVYGDIKTGAIEHLINYCQTPYFVVFIGQRYASLAAIGDLPF